MTQNLARLACLLASFALAGCSLAPGSNINTSDIEADNLQWFAEQGRGGRGQPSASELMDIVAINPSLLNERRQTPTRPAQPDVLGGQLREYDYRIGRGDVLHVVVYEHPELTIPAGNYRSVEESGNVVQNDGTIYYPYIGELYVEGATVGEVRSEIAERLAQFIASPQVEVRVVGYHSKRAYITGQVANPGPQPITNVPLTVLDAITRAGGLTNNANWHEVVLARPDGEEISLSVHEMLNNGQLNQNLLMRHGDMLHVQAVGNQKVYVLGELNRIDSLPMGDLRLSLTDAIAQSGGISQTAAEASGIFVIRQNAPDSDKLATVYQLDARNALAMALGAQFMLEPADIIYVTTAPITRWNRVLNQLLPSITAFLRLEGIGI